MIKKLMLVFLFSSGFGASYAFADDDAVYYCLESCDVKNNACVAKNGIDTGACIKIYAMCEDRCYNG